MQRVITYQAPHGDTIDLTPAQIAVLEQFSAWPRNSRGEEYCSVSWGLRKGTPTYTDGEIRAYCLAIAASEDRPTPRD